MALFCTYNIMRKVLYSKFQIKMFEIFYNFIKTQFKRHFVDR